MVTNDKPAILSAAEIEALRLALNEDEGGRSFERIAHALLAHLDALTHGDVDAEALGREVRRIWIAWAKEQPNPKPSWLVPWEGLSEPDREVDRRIGTAIHAIGFAAGRSGKDDAYHDANEELRGEIVKDTLEIRRLRAEINDLTMRLDRSTRAIRRLMSELDRAQKDRDKALTDLDNCEVIAAGDRAHMAELEREIARLTAELAANRQEAANLAHQVDEARRTEDRLTAELADGREAHAEEIDAWRAAAGLDTAEELSAALDRDRRRFHSELDAARAEGARVERDDIERYVLRHVQEVGARETRVGVVLNWIRGRAGAAEQAIRARGEGGPK